MFSCECCKSFNSPLFYRRHPAAACFILKSLDFINYFPVNCFGSQLITSTEKIDNIEKIDNNLKEVIKKQFENVPKRKDDAKIQMTQIIGLIRPMLTLLFHT